MLPRRGFRVQSHGVESAAAEYWVRGRDISAIAFVHAGEGAFDALVEHDAGIGAWLAQHDSEPSSVFTGPGAWLASLSAMDYQGALAIVEPTMYLDEGGTPVGVAFGTLGARAGAGRRAETPGVGAATDRTRFQVELGEESATIVHWQRFRIGSPLDLRGRFAGAEHAAFGWIKVSYLLWADGRAEAHCATSFAPSVWFFLDYQRTFRHDMFAMTAADLDRCLRPKSGTPSGTTWAALDTSTGYVHAVA